MKEETMPPGLWQQTRQAVEAWGHNREAEPAGTGTAPIGQVLVLPQIGEPRVVWSVLRKEAEESERRLLVATDSNPLVGSGDVAVTDPTTGPLTLRCRFASWVNGKELGDATLLGVLPPEALARASSRRQEIEAGSPPLGTFSEQETEEDPEYQDWIEDIVQPAVRKLEARANTLPFPTSRPAQPLPLRRAAWMRWAAVLAFVALGTGSGFLWWQQAQEIAGLRDAVAASEASHRQAIAELEARRADLEAQYQTRLRAAGEDRTRLESEHRAQLAELEAKIAQLREASTIKNPVLAFLEPAGAERGSTKLTVGPEASHLVLRLAVEDPAGTEFRIEVGERLSGKQIFVQNGLRADIRGEVRLGLPTALMPPGDYRLRLFRKERGSWRRVREHLIEIAEEIQQRPAPW